MKRVLIALAALAAAAPAPAMAFGEEWIKLTREELICASQATHKQWVDLVISRDHDAADAFKAQMIAAKQCALISWGTEVYVQKMRSGYLCYRPRGYTSCGWTMVSDDEAQKYRMLEAY